jgi:hypothetical protein
MNHALQTKLTRMVAGQIPSTTVAEMTEFSSPEDLFEHLMSTAQPEMNDKNYGKGVGMWSIGHRIARSMFDHSDLEDVRKCWSKANIFAQWYQENASLKVKLPLTSELHQMKSQLPNSWQGQVPTEEMREVLENRALKGGKL